jgi:eukaryotic-like serine/threonine-protein kinase
MINGSAGNGITGIWTLTTDGGGFQQLQSGTGEATLSADGSRIVFEKKQELWQMGPNGENLVRLISLPQGPQLAGHAGLFTWSNLAWSPDGRWLTYLRKTDENGSLVLEGRLLEDGRTVTILTDPDLRGYCWLSANKVMLNRWEAPDKPFSNLWEVDIDPHRMEAVSRPHRLTNWAGFAVLNMNATQDGKRIALTRKTDQSNILIGELTDNGNSLSQPRRIGTQDRVEWPGGWSADSKALLFQSDRTGNMNLFRQPIDATDAEVVVTDQNDNRAPSLGPDRAWVLYFAWPRSGTKVNTAGLMRRPVGGGLPELVLEAKVLRGAAQASYRVVLPTMVGQPAFRCPSKSRTSCVLSEAGPHEVTFYSFVPEPGAVKTEMFRIQTDHPDGLAWDLSPDGSQIAYAEYSWQSASIHIRELTTNVTRDIPLKGLTELSTLSWSADGKGFFATTFAVTGSTLYHVTAEGKYSVLYKGAKEVEGARSSPDGRYLAFGDVQSASNVWVLEGFPQ